MIYNTFSIKVAFYLVMAFTGNIGEQFFLL